ANYEPTLPINRWFITRDCKNPELAFRVGDAMFNEETTLRGRYGQEGVNWERPASDDICGLEELGYEATYKMIHNEWTVLQNKNWRNNQPSFGSKTPAGSVLPKDNLLADEWHSNEVVIIYQGLKPEPDIFIPVLFFEED